MTAACSTARRPLRARQALATRRRARAGAAMFSANASPAPRIPTAATSAAFASVARTCLRGCSASASCACSRVMRRRAPIRLARPAAATRPANASKASPGWLAAISAPTAKTAWRCPSCALPRSCASPSRVTPGQLAMHRHVPSGAAMGPASQPDALNPTPAAPLRCRSPRRHASTGVRPPIFRTPREPARRARAPAQPRATASSAARTPRAPPA